MNGLHPLLTGDKTKKFMNQSGILKVFRACYSPLSTLNSGASRYTGREARGTTTQASHPADDSNSADTYNRINVEAVDPAEAHDHGLGVADQAKPRHIGNPFGNFLKTKPKREFVTGPRRRFQMEGGVRKQVENVNNSLSSGGRRFEREEFRKNAGFHEVADLYRRKEGFGAVADLIIYSSCFPGIKNYRRYCRRSLSVCQLLRLQVRALGFLYAVSKSAFTNRKSVWRLHTVQLMGIYLPRHTAMYRPCLWASAVSAAGGAIVSTPDRHIRRTYVNKNEQPMAYTVIKTIRCNTPWDGYSEPISFKTSKYLP